jgi:ParB family chromosome partitioning protein
VTKKNLAGLSGLSDLSALQNASQEDKILFLTVDQILVKPQVRKHFKNIESLAKNMREKGQIQPIVVSPKDRDTGLYELQKGGRRVKAAMLIPGFKIQAMVDAEYRPPSEAHASQLSENIQREALLPHEIGKALLAIKNERISEGLKATGRELSKLLDMAESWVSKHLDLAEIPDDLAELISDEVTSDSDIIHGLKLLSEISPVLYKELLVQARNVEDGGISRSTVREALKVAKGQVTPFVDKGANQLQGEAGQGAGLESGQSPSVPTRINGSAATGDGAGGVDPEKIPHAETINAKAADAAGGGAQQTDEHPPVGTNAAPPTLTVVPSTAPKQAPSKKPGKNDTIIISPTQLVIGISVSFDKKVLPGELLTDRVFGDKRKAWVRVMDGGKQLERLVSVDDITIMTMAKFATD